MFKEHDIVALTASIPEDGLEVGDVGTIVHIYADGEAFEVEFMGFHGETVAISTVPCEHVRSVDSGEVKNARKIKAKA